MVIICLLCGCKKEEVNEKKTTAKKTIEKKMVALITDYESNDDKMYAGAIWKGVCAFAKKEKYNKKKYNATVENSITAKKKNIEKAINDGADILVFADETYATLVCEYQEKYKDIAMLLVGFEPLSETTEVEYKDNTSALFFKEEEVGYLTGYVLVAEGYRKLGFYGGKKNDASSAYGYGFIQGADVAAKRLGLRLGQIQMEYRYTGGYSASNRIIADAKKCYSNGTEVIFCCAGNALISVIDAVDKLSSRKIVSSVIDSTSESDAILFSSVLNIKESVENMLCDYVLFDNSWGQTAKGKRMELGIKQDAIGLTASESSWRLRKVTIEKYNAFYNNVKESNIEIYGNRIPTTSYVSVNMREIR